MLSKNILENKTKTKNAHYSLEVIPGPTVRQGNWGAKVRGQWLTGLWLVPHPHRYHFPGARRGHEGTEGCWKKPSLFSLCLPGQEDRAGALSTGFSVDRGIKT